MRSSSNFCFHHCHFFTTILQRFNIFSTFKSHTSISIATNSPYYGWFRSNSSTTTITRSINNALKLLNLSPSTNANRSKTKHEYTLKELRDAYFTAAKLCHPDSPNAEHHSIHNDHNDTERKEYLTNKFHSISDAYELLRKYSKSTTTTNMTTSINDKHDKNSNDDDNLITKSEEEDYKQACLEFLGVDAEIVEESKRCPLFREWLKGRTVDAFLWNLFLMKHGGLAPMLRRKEKHLGIAQGDSRGKEGIVVTTRKNRRRRKD